ncbi:MAG: hypothetical protein AAFW81_10370 [Pseudomonadota bacterium]
MTAMKSNAPWSVKGIERDARETAKEAAKREGMTVGEWLNQMIYTAGDPEASDGEIEGLKLRDIVTAVEALHKRLSDSATESAAETREVTRKVGDLVERVQRLERENPDDAASADFEARLRRVEQGGGDRERVDALKALEKAVAQVAVQFSSAQKTTVERLDATESQIQNLAARIDTAGVSDDDTSGVVYLKNAVDALQSRIARTEKLAGETARGEGFDPAFVESTDNRLRVLGDEIKRGGDQIRALEQTIGKLSQQIEGAERRSAEGVQKTAETLADIRTKLGAGELDTPSRDDIAALVSDQTRDTVERVDRLQSSFEDMMARLEELLDDGDASNADWETAKAPSVSTTASDDQDEPAIDEPASLDAQMDVASKSALEEVEDDADDDDFFSFADEIDADTDGGADDDDFGFELDDDDKSDEPGAETTASDDFLEDETLTARSEPAADTEVDPKAADKSDTDADDADEDNFDEGAALLSEVQEALGVGPAVSKADTDDRDDLDSLLSDLDDFDEPSSADALNTDNDLSTDEAPPIVDPQGRLDKTIGDSTVASANVADSDNDGLRAPGREAKDDAPAAASTDVGARTKRSSLTPKQRAILAARARRKRLAAAGGAGDADSEHREATKKALHAATEDVTEASRGDFDSDAEDKEAGAGLGARLSALKSKIPFLSKDKAGNADEDSSADAQNGETLDLDGDRAALETLKGAVSARPVTLALGVGLFLAAGLLFFMIKDFIFAPRGESAAIPQTAENLSASDLSAGVEIPAPPAIDPRQLYQDASLGLSTAQTDGEIAVAIDKLEQAALLGHPPAQLQLGELYKSGQGVEQDLSDARMWYRRAANGGNVLAMHRVGVMTARGDGGEANTPEAIGWFEQAANRGLVDSQYNLGAIYHPSGEGDASGLQDAGKAYYWYALAARNGDAQAAPLATGVGAALSADARAEIDEQVAAWEALPSDAEANQLAATG